VNQDFIFGVSAALALSLVCASAFIRSGDEYIFFQVAGVQSIFMLVLMISDHEDSVKGFLVTSILCSYGIYLFNHS